MSKAAKIATRDAAKHESRAVSARRVQEVRRMTGKARLDAMRDAPAVDKRMLLADLHRIYSVMTGERYYDYDAREWVE